MSHRSAAAAALSIASCLALVSFAARPARAAIATITNGSFESGTFAAIDPGNHVPSLPVGSTAITGWTVIGGGASRGRHHKPLVSHTAGEGSLFLYPDGHHHSGP